jgi:phototropin
VKGHCFAAAQLLLPGSGLPLLVKYDSRIKDASEGPVQAVLGVRGARSVLGSRENCANFRVSQAFQGDTDAIPPLPPSRAGLDLATTLERIQQSFLISDPNLPDCPIVYASDNFCDFTGCGSTLQTETNPP